MEILSGILWTEIVKQLDYKHSTTSAHLPQCNSQAEVCNKTIASYLSTMVDETTLYWEEFIPALCGIAPFFQV